MAWVRAAGKRGRYSAPRGNSDRLRAAFAPGVATWRLAPGAGHNDIGSRTDYFAGWAVPGPAK